MHSSSSSSVLSDIDKADAIGHTSHTAKSSTTTDRNNIPVTDKDKETLAVYESHNADIPSNEISVLDERGELKDLQAEILQPEISHHSKTSQHHLDTKRVTGDPEKGPDNITEETDPNLVWWDGPDDPQNPLNFSKWLKILNITLVSAICFVTPLASSMFAPGVPNLMAEFKSSNVELASFTVSVYVLGFAVGPLFFAPMSELYGRLPIYHICNVCFIAFTVACALSPNLNSLIGFRFLAGVFGSAPLTNGGGTIADLVAQESRGRAMSAFVMGPIVGPIIGPVAGGYLTEAKGWRWAFWLLAIVSGGFSILSLIFMRETFAATILQRKTVRLQKETGNLELRSKLDSGLSPQDLFLRSIIRPARMLIFSPIVLSTSIYVGVVYGYLYLLFTTFTLVFEGTYGFSAGSVGLTFLGLGVGSLFGVFAFAVTSDRLMKKYSAEADAAGGAAGGPPSGMKPEYRLPMMIKSAPLIPIGLLIYAWTTEYKVHWIVPIMSTALIGVGNLMVFMCISTYLVDAFSTYAASALAANTVIRSIMGAVLPLAGQKMYIKLGLGWGNTLLAFVAIALLPVPVVLVKWGEKLRNKFEIKDL